MSILTVTIRSLRKSPSGSLTRSTDMIGRHSMTASALKSPLFGNILFRNGSRAANVHKPKRLSRCRPFMADEPVFLRLKFAH